MAAVGSMILEQMEINVKRFRHALDYAPGMDYPNVDIDEWTDLSEKVNALDESLLKAKRQAKCIERKTNAKTTEDIRAGYSVDELYKLIKACRRG